MCVFLLNWDMKRYHLNSSLFDFGQERFMGCFFVVRKWYRQELVKKR